MGTHLSPLDAAFLELEEADEAAHMHIGWAMVFDPPPGGERPSLERLREQTRERLEVLPRFRRRLSSPRVGTLSLPTWEPEPDLDPGELLRRATLPAPGGDAELMEWLGDFFSHRLDRSRPLWETTLLEGLEGGRWALVTKVHHCLIDGISGAEVAAVLLDAEAEPTAESTSIADVVVPAEEESGDGSWAHLRGAAEGTVGAVRHPRRILSAISQSRAMLETLVRDEVFAAPRTSLNGAIGATRRMAAVDVPLDEVKAIKNELGGTVNDVVLAATAGGLRALFEARGEAATVDHIRAMVPVSLRQASESLALGNRVSSLFVDVAINEPDPLLRYRKISASSDALKSGNAAAGTDAVIRLAGLTPPLIQSVVARLSFTPRLFNITITNVPASPVTLYALGAPMVRVVPLVPIFSGHALGVAVVSYDGTVSFGLNADRDSVPDLEVMSEGIEMALAELQHAATAHAKAA
ncbi:MAG TPA: wax ester/triacylglycerol synthase family O-acyltransferase [Solirubrobacterales bacterium]|nr:wax ester/triacylglycerol synthase family O-acyltransferase [Solirubrobacterales bacterium]